MLTCRCDKFRVQRNSKTLSVDSQKVERKLQVKLDLGGIISLCQYHSYSWRWWSLFRFPQSDFIQFLWWLSYPDLGLHLATPDHTPSNHNPNHAQGLKWALVMVNRPTHWAPSARVHHLCNTCYLILKLTQFWVDYCTTHSCNDTQLEVWPIKVHSS